MRCERSSTGSKPRPAASIWSNYESACPSYTSVQQAAKRQFVERALREVHPSRVLDVGSNSGEFSLMAAAAGASVVSIDSDPEMVAAAVARRQRRRRRYSAAGGGFCPAHASRRLARQGTRGFPRKGRRLLRLRPDAGRDPSLDGDRPDSPGLKSSMPSPLSQLVGWSWNTSDPRTLCSAIWLGAAMRYTGDMAAPFSKSARGVLSRS